MKKLASLFALITVLSTSAYAFEFISKDGKSKIDMTQDPYTITLWQGDKVITEYTLIISTPKTIDGVAYFDFVSADGKTLQADITDTYFMTGSQHIIIDGVTYLDPQK